MKRTTIKDLKDMAFELPRYSTKAQLVSIRKIFLSALEYIEDLYEPKKTEDTKDLINDSQRLVAYKHTDGVDDSEKVEFTKNEIEALLFLIEKETRIQEIKGEMVSESAATIYHKLNEMLKEKEAEECCKDI